VALAFAEAPLDGRFLLIFLHAAHERRLPLHCSVDVCVHELLLVLLVVLPQPIHALHNNLVQWPLAAIFADKHVTAGLRKLQSIVKECCRAVGRGVLHGHIRGH
jgi:hypothetical protein